MASKFDRSHNHEAYRERLERLFSKGAARLITHGDAMDTQHIRESALFEDRKPHFFVHDITPDDIDTASHFTERITGARLAFSERRIDNGAGPFEEPLPDSVMLMVQSIDERGAVCESALELYRPVGDDTVYGAYNRVAIGQNADVFMDDNTDGEYFRTTLTEDDFALLERALDTLPDAPEMEGYAS